MHFQRFATIAALALLLAACGKNGGGNNGKTTVDGADGGVSMDASPADGGDSGVSYPTDGPGKVLDLEAAHEITGTFIELNQESSQTVAVSGTEGEVFKIEYSFRSQTVLRRNWEHDVQLFVPKTPNPDVPAGAFVIVPASTQNPQRGVSDAGNLRTNYAAALTAHLGIPAMVVPGIPGVVDTTSKREWDDAAEPRCIVENVGRDRYVGCMLEILAATSDTEADPFRHVAYTYVKTVTVAQEIVRRVFDVDWGDDAPGENLELEKAVILAEGGSAVGARMAAAVDDRIVGVYAGSADFAAIPTVVDRIDTAWGTDKGWFNDVGAFDAWLDTEDGVAWLEAVDPAQWPEMLEGKSFVNAIGTNDPYFPLGLEEAVLAPFPDDTNRIVVNDYGAGIGSSAHLSGWWAFVAHVFLDRPWLVIDAGATDDAGNVEVTATVSDASIAGQGVLFSTQQHRDADDLDYRDTVWVAGALTQDGDAYTGTAAPISVHRAAYVRVADEVQFPSQIEDADPVVTQGPWSSPVFVFE